MSRRANPPLPPTPFGLLLVEGGDERGVCEAVAGAAAWSGLICRSADGRDDLPSTARLAQLDPNFQLARSIGIVLDMESDPAKAQSIAADTLAAFGATTAPQHGVVSPIPGTSLRVGVFFAPDGASHGSIETLCRRAVRNTALAACVDQLVVCAGAPHTLQARADKGWLRAYLGMSADPNVRFHQAFTASDGIDPSHVALDGLRTFLQSL